jgi:galactose mutarotase-like enzyme
MHGLMLKSKATGIKVTQDKSGAKVTGIIHAGDFGGHWLSSTDLEVTIELGADAVDTTVVAKNVGKEDEPMAIGWHPWLNMPSGARDQLRVQIPGSSMDEMGADRMPTGKMIPVAGTRFDFQPAGGRTLDSDSYDVNLTNLQWANGVLSVSVTDPAAHYGVRLEGFSPEMKSIQMASPVGKSVVAIEHQYNYLDPFGKEWGTTDTGMVTLKPGQSTRWHVRLNVFVPEQVAQKSK